MKKIPGVGKVGTQKLTTKNITLCEQLQKISLETLYEWFGKFGERLYDYCRGIDHRSVQTSIAVA